MVTAVTNQQRVFKHPNQFRIRKWLLTPKLSFQSLPAPDDCHRTTCLPQSKGFADGLALIVASCTTAPDTWPCGVFVHQTTDPCVRGGTGGGHRQAGGVLRGIFQRTMLDHVGLSENGGEK